MHVCDCRRHTMTRNGQRVNCYCDVYRCQGKEIDWRTRNIHAKKDAENRPFYPVEDAEPQQEEHKDQDGSPQQEELPSPSVPPLPQQDVPFEDIVSHVNSLPNSDDPVFHTVHKLMQ
jgi:hypothetical protein